MVQAAALSVLESGWPGARARRVPGSRAHRASVSPAAPFAAPLSFTAGSLGCQGCRSAASSAPAPAPGPAFHRDRLFDPDTGRWDRRDPLIDILCSYQIDDQLLYGDVYVFESNKMGDNIYYVDIFNLYGGICNPTDIDSQGLWEAGLKGKKGDLADRGHSDFPGSGDLGGPFNYNLEDEDWHTSPGNPASTWRHFRPLSESENELITDVKECGKDGFERHAHQMQDFFSHFGQGYRAYKTAGHIPGTVTSFVGRNAGFSPARPDNARDYNDAFEAAKARTQLWYDRWVKCCCKEPNSNSWGKKPNRPEDDCGAPAPEYLGFRGDTNKAPPPRPERNKGGLTHLAEQGVGLVGRGIISGARGVVAAGYYGVKGVQSAWNWAASLF